MRKHCETFKIQSDKEVILLGYVPGQWKHKGKSVWSELQDHTKENVWVDSRRIYQFSYLGAFLAKKLACANVQRCEMSAKLAWLLWRMVEDMLGRQIIGLPRSWYPVSSPTWGQTGKQMNDKRRPEERGGDGRVALDFSCLSQGGSSFWM
jgi:hypothetical protein